MGVTVKFFANFREAAGVGTAEINGAEDIASLLDALVTRFGEKLANELFVNKKLHPAVNILLNGRSVNLQDGLNTKLKDGDVVAIFPPVSGG